MNKHKIVLKGLLINNFEISVSVRVCKMPLESIRFSRSNCQIRFKSNRELAVVNQITRKYCQNGCCKLFNSVEIDWQFNALVPCWKISLATQRLFISTLRPPENSDKFKNFQKNYFLLHIFVSIYEIIGAVLSCD